MKNLRYSINAVCVMSEQKIWPIGSQCLKGDNVLFGLKHFADGPISINAGISRYGKFDLRP